ncbi:hypothetical protein Desal_3164 [Maridesulfovibrio salexigens DSM 2638]|uniref:Uncharacterized protein n=1 Tax=Maridesulfovibrio salexigens (strain ATCC 14822 / DSM 2638 / NCIMB 8403 / VKM B-1763) TaxID=526222 RepID=C6C214_MARSD|nr:hypothetical protein Desal_3164 [Maridesulfovibrio salexigens DSM 2638]
MWGIYSSIMAAFKRKRKCPQCGNISIVSIKDKDKTIKCSKCGKALPPQAPTV